MALAFDLDEPSIGRRSITTSIEKAVKAITGAGASGWLYQRQLQPLDSAPQQLAMQAQMLYRTHAIVNEVERQVSGRGSSVGIALEDADGNAVDDDSAPAYQAIRDLLEKPQAELQDIGRRMTRRELWRLTLRHMGLCGTAFWWFDQAEALAGTPLGIMYVNPARMWSVEDKNGNLLGWSLDAPPEQHGTPLTIEQVLPFYLDPPDWGHFGIGLVESIWTKSQLNQLADKHEANTLANGGRIAGIISPKVAGQITPDQWKEFVNDFRGIAEDPNSARRVQIAQGPLDYTRTSATMNELAVVDISKLSAEDIQAHWGVPPSQTGRSGPAGLNSGTTKGYDEATLWQGAIHPRLQVMYETIQYGLLDKFKALGTPVELKIEEPEFDDSGPAFEMAQRAIFLPLTNKERRDLIGLPPLGDDSMDNAIMMPTTTFLWATAPDENGNPVPDLALPGNVLNDLQDQVDVLKQVTAGTGAITDPNKIQPAKVTAGTQSVGQVTPLKVAVTPGKADVVRTPFMHLRSAIDAKITPQISASVQSVLDAQKADVIAKVKRHYAHIMIKPDDSGVWWNGARWKAELRKAIAPHTEAIAAKITKEAVRLMPRLVPAKAAPVAFADRVTARVLDRGAARITGINDTTQQGIADILANPEYDSLDGLITAIEGWTGFAPYRSELIARTESMDAYNAAALGTYGEFGVDEVQAIDGDQDEECAARSDQFFSVDDASTIEDHPNGTLDWLPVVPQEAAKAELAVPPQFVFNIPPTTVVHHAAPITVEAPNVNYTAGDVHVAAADPTPITVNVPEGQTPTVNFQMDVRPLADALAPLTEPRTTVKDVLRDGKGNITRVVESEQ